MEPTNTEEKIVTLARQAAAEWKEWSDSDDPISGADAVDWINAFFRRIKTVEAGGSVNGGDDMDDDTDLDDAEDEYDPYIAADDAATARWEESEGR